jgi:hypothetical protein
VFTEVSKPSEALSLVPGADAIGHRKRVDRGIVVFGDEDAQAIIQVGIREAQRRKQIGAGLEAACSC